MATKPEWAWFAGLFEGEGCIAFVGKNSVRLQVESTDLDVVERMQSISGYGSIVKKSVLSVSRKSSWKWQIGRADCVEEIIGQIEPYLCSRRLKRAHEAQKRLVQVGRQGFCKKGHKKTLENTYRSPGGQEHCRACRRLSKNM